MMLFYYFISVYAINRNHNYYCFLIEIFENFLKNFFLNFCLVKYLILFYIISFGLGKIQISLLITLIFGYFFLNPFNVLSF